jgi:hypothetical protein
MMVDGAVTWIERTAVLDGKGKEPPCDDGQTKKETVMWTMGEMDRWRKRYKTE